MTLHQQIAKALGWSEEDTKKFSLQMLREMVRGKNPKLAYEISRAIRTGSYLTGADNHG